MKKIILILAISIAFIACKKKSTSSTTPTIYCVYSYDNGNRTFQGCAESKEAMQSKTIELRNAGFTDVRSETKTKCSECN